MSNGWKLERNKGTICELEILIPSLSSTSQNYSSIQYKIIYGSVLSDGLVDLLFIHSNERRLKRKVKQFVHFFLTFNLAVLSGKTLNL